MAVATVSPSFGPLPSLPDNVTYAGYVRVIEILADGTLRVVATFGSPGAIFIGRTLDVYSEVGAGLAQGDCAEVEFKARPDPDARHRLLRVYRRAPVNSASCGGS